MQDDDSLRRLYSYLATFVDIATVLAVVGKRVTVGAFARERADGVTAATIAANSQKQAALVDI